MSRNYIILVIGLNEPLDGLLERWLGEAGHIVMFDGRPHREDRPPQLVIAYLATPRGPTPFVRSLRELYDAPILLLSPSFRSGLEGSVETATRLEVHKVLPIPFSRDELLGAVRESMESSA